MLSRVLFMCSLACCAIVLASFALFAKDQLAHGSKQQVSTVQAGNAVSGGSTTPRHVAQPRRFIDGAARKLTSPFRSLVQGDSPWAVWLITTALALVAYGLGLGLLARVIRLNQLRV